MVMTLNTPESSRLPATVVNTVGGHGVTNTPGLNVAETRKSNMNNPLFTADE
jgi:hypothetical protein